ncbi:hypothetical protein EJ02DRAFT_319918, partial [Clathrospora elynae]
SQQPKRHASLFHRHRSNSRLSVRPAYPEQTNEPRRVFEGTDAVAQNRRVALQRVVEVHDALEVKYQSESSSPTTATSSERPTSSSSSISIDVFTTDFASIPFPDAEVRAFKYFLRMWDPSEPSDPYFDTAIESSRLQFEEAASKHFFRRIALWNESEEVLEASRRKLFRRGEKEKSELGKLWMVEKGRSEHGVRDELKQVTTREGLAQLLWTLLHDFQKPLAPEFFEECKEALKRKYGM